MGQRPSNTQYFAAEPDSPGHTPVYVREGDDGEHTELEQRQGLRNHSPSGFSWGYSGSGAAQLALAILADFYDDDSRAMDQYMDFKREFVAQYSDDAPFYATAADIHDVCGH